MNNVLHEPRCEALGSTVNKAVGDVLEKKDKIIELGNEFIDLANKLLQKNRATPIDIYYSISALIVDILGTWYAKCKQYENFLKEKTNTDCVDMIIVFFKTLEYLTKIQLYAVIEEDLGGPKGEDILVREASFETCNNFIEDLIQKTFASR